MDEKHAFFGKGYFTQIHKDLLHSDAFIGLSKSAQLVLLYFIEAWNEADRTNAFVNGGIQFTHAMCPCEVSDVTFQKAMLEIISHGFVQRRKASERRPGERYWYRGSHRWRSTNLESMEKNVDFEEARARIEKVRARRRLWAEQGQLKLALDELKKVRKLA